MKTKSFILCARLHLQSSVCSFMKQTGARTLFIARYSSIRRLAGRRAKERQQLAGCWLTTDKPTNKEKSRKIARAKNSSTADRAMKTTTPSETCETRCFFAPLFFRSAPSRAADKQAQLSLREFVLSQLLDNSLAFKHNNARIRPLARRRHHVLCAALRRVAPRGCRARVGAFSSPLGRAASDFAVVALSTSCTRSA